MSIPATMKAYVVQRNLLWPIRAWILGSYANHPKLVDRPVPQPRDDELLVKVETFAAVRPVRVTSCEARCRVFCRFGLTVPARTPRTRRTSTLLV